MSVNASASIIFGIPMKDECLRWEEEQVISKFFDDRLDEYNKILFQYGGTENYSFGFLYLHVDNNPYYDIEIYKKFDVEKMNFDISQEDVDRLKKCHKELSSYMTTIKYSNWNRPEEFEVGWYVVAYYG